MRTTNWERYTSLERPLEVCESYSDSLEAIPQGKPLLDKMRASARTAMAPLAGALRGPERRARESVKAEPRIGGHAIVVASGEMSNDDVYASGLLTRALDPATQPPQIRAFMQAEIELLRSIVAGMTWLDVGCGTGRHLAMMSGIVRFGVGLDYEHAYVAEARRRCAESRLHFITGDATRLPVSTTFDIATCMTNTWGTMSDKPAVLDEMRASARRRILSVFSLESISARREWYRAFGHPVVEQTDEWLVTDGGLRSEHFTETRLRAIVGVAGIRRCAGIGYTVEF